MKIIVTSIAFLFVSLISAQEIKPIFEQDGEQVKATYFHDNGKVAQTGSYVDGKLHGEWKMYNKEGKKIAMGRYVLGKKTGKWFFWEGEGLREVDYTDNKIANVIKWTDAESVVLNK